MPMYLFIHPETEEVREEYQKMNDTHAYVDEEGIEWRRVFTPHNVNMDSNADPFSSKQFVEKTRGKSLSVGDLWDMSADLAVQREQKAGGKDPIKEKHDAKQKKMRKGREIPTSNVRTSSKSRE